MQPQEAQVWAALMRAIDGDDAPAIEEIARAGSAQMRAVLRLHADADREERTPLMIAYWLGRGAAANAMIRAGADYDQVDASGRPVSWYDRNYGRGENAAALSESIDASERLLTMEKHLAPVEDSEEERDASRRGDI